MARYRCRVCRGEYTSPQEGMEYYHQCPPLVTQAFRDALPRPNARNENIRGGRGEDRGEPRRETMSREELPEE